MVRSTTNTLGEDQREETMTPIDMSLLPPPPRQFRFLRILAIIQEIVGALAFLIGIPLAMAAMRDSFPEPASYPLAAFGAGLALVTGGEFIRVILQIEENTRRGRD
jgi:hypothetical protein